MKKNYFMLLLVLLFGVSLTISAAEKQAANEPEKTQTEQTEELPYVRTPANHWSIAAHVGVGFLDGDQSQKFNDIFPRTFADCAFGVNVEYSFSPIFGLYLEYMRNPYSGTGNYPYTAKIKGLPYSKIEPFDYKGIAHDVTAGLSLNLLNLFYQYRKQVVSLYINAGLGVSFYEATGFEKGTGKSAQPVVMDREVNGVQLQPSFKSGRTMTIPLGFSLEYSPTRYLSILWNSQIHIYTKDNYDCMQKGQSNDNFIYTGLGLRWKINSPKDKEREHIRNMSMGDFEKSKESDQLRKEMENTKKRVKATEDKADGVKSEVDELRTRVDMLETDVEAKCTQHKVDTIFIASPVHENEKLTAEQIQKIFDEETNVPSIYFKFASTELTSQSLIVMSNIARIMHRNPDYKLELRGYCDNVGSEAYNQGLSLRRAETVRDRLIEDFGVNARAISVFGMGKVFSGKENFQINRRCDFILTK